MAVSSIVSLLDEMTKSETLEDVWRLHTHAMRDYGFDRLLYALSVNHNSSEPQHELSDVLILSNHDKSYTDRFIKGGMYRDAPMLKWALNNQGERSWAWLGERMLHNDLSQTERRVLQFNLHHQVTAGYTISFSSGLIRRKSAIALTAARGMEQAEVDDLWQEHGKEITVINHVLNLRALTLPAESMLHRLTARQREVLELVGDGMSMADVAERLSLSSATVEKHLRLARDALGCETTAQAVTKAAMQQQLYLSTEKQKRAS